MPTPNSLERITRAPATGGVFDENPLVNQLLDVTEGSVMRALPDLRPLRGSELSLEPIEHPIEDQPLPLIDCCTSKPIPEMRLAQNGGQGRFGRVQSVVKAIQKPLHPGRNVERFPLRFFEDVVISVPLLPDLRRHAVKPLRAVL